MAADELLRLTGLEVHFPVRAGVFDSMRGTIGTAWCGPWTAST